jgi:hypothetical protein
LEFDIESSGNGYVWAFERRGEELALVYPINCPADCGNDISVDRGFHLPDQRRRTIFAGDHSGEERLLFFVTSSNTADSANRLAGQFQKALILKASGGLAKENWGYAEVTYGILR